MMAGFESKYIKKQPAKENNLPSKVKMHVDVSGGKVAIKTIKVPEYPLKAFNSENGPVFGTEVFFEGRLFYPVVYAVKGEKGWLLPKPTTLLDDDILFFNDSLKREETELDLQGYFRTVDHANWRDYIDQLRGIGFEAVKQAFGLYLKKMEELQ